MALRLVSSKPVRLDLGDGDWLEVRRDISKRQFTQLLSQLPDDFGADNQTITAGDSDRFAQAVFEAFILDWSVKDEYGSPIPPTVENYQELARESGTAVDLAIMSHFNGQQPDEATTNKSEDSSPA